MPTSFLQITRQQLRAVLTAGLVSALSLTAPLSALGQADDIEESLEPASTAVDDSLISSFARLLDEGRAASESPDIPSIVLNQADIKDWKDLDRKDLSLYDKRIMTQLLPALVSEDGPGFDQVIVDRVRRGYTDDTTKASRKFPDTTVTSQHYYGKAVSLASLGTILCDTDSLFARNLAARKPVWVQWQTGEQDELVRRWPLARSFDALAKQIFWLEGRAITSSPIAVDSWDGFLQALAKSELEERFGIIPGTLTATPLDSLSKTLAKERLAALLGLPNLPEVDSRAEFYESIGRRQLESELNLPRYSFEGATWNAIYRTIGQRVLEKELGLPDRPLSTTVTSENSGDTALSFGGEARFAELVEALKERQSYYSDLTTALNLPTQDYLPTTEGLGFADRLLLGDTDAFTTLGAYYLADSLELSPDDTKLLITNLEAEKASSERVIDLKTARPINPRLAPDKLFSLDVQNHPAVFEALGRQFNQTITDRLPRINEDVLLAITQKNVVPNFSSFLGILTNKASREALITKLTKATLGDANYPSAITEVQLTNRGRQLFADASGVSTETLRQLEEGTAANDTKEATLDAIANAMNWPTSGDSTRTVDRSLVRDLIESSNKPLAPNARKALTQRVLEAGARQLWFLLGLPDSLHVTLNNYFFQSSSIDGIETIPTPTPESEAQGNEDDEEGESIPDDFFASAEAELPTIKQMGQITAIPERDITFFFTGQMRPAMIRATAGLLARDLSEESTVTPTKVSQFLDNPDISLGDQIITQTENSFLRPKFIEESKKAIAANNAYGLWDSFQREMVYQWNMECPDKQTAAKEAVTKLITYLIGLPDTSFSQGDEVGRPIQIMTYEGLSGLKGSLRNRVTETYPNADGKNIKYGLYGFKRGFDSVYIAY